MKRLLSFGLGLFLTVPGLFAQELYVATEPASNMPKNSVGVRLTSELMPRNSTVRLAPELMFGLSKELMVHGSAYFSDMYQKSLRYEGFGVYAKYRFLSIDSLQHHFRMAVFGRYGRSRNPSFSADEASHTLSHSLIDEINLEGDNSGVQAGLIATQLLHKLAISGSVSYLRATDNAGGNKRIPGQADGAFAYSMSAGYLAWPRVYESYSQPNFNFYLEFLGKANQSDRKSFLEAAPALQVILNSQTRLDFSKRFQVYGNMNRTTKNMWLFRIEHNLFNVL